jgi:hypothetical protein
MKRTISIALALICLATAASGKMLVMSSNKATSAAYPLGNLQRALGFEYDRVLASDTTFINSIYPGGSREGEYSCAMLWPLPTIGTSYDSQAELDAGGWLRVGMYVNRGSARAFPIPLIVPHSGMSTLGVWAEALTGQIANGPTFSTDGLPIVNAFDDSLYMNIHATGAGTVSRVADSTSWCDALLWVDAAVGASTQKYAVVWRTVGTGSHQVVYVKTPAVSYSQFTLAMAIAMFEKVVPYEVCLLMGNYGYVGNTTPDGWFSAWGPSVDTVSCAYNLYRIRDYVVANDIKLDFLVDSYNMKTQAKANILLVPTLATQHPGNIRMTHSTNRAWSNTGSGSDVDWLGYSGNKYYLTINRRIARSLDSASVYYDIDDDRLVGIGAYYNGYWGSTGKIDSVLRAVTDAGVRDIYTYSNAVALMPPRSVYHGTSTAARTWIGEDYDELRSYAMGRFASDDLSTTNDTCRIFYINTVARKASRATYSAQISRFMFGEAPSTIPASLGDGMTLPRAARIGQPAFGIMINSSFITGGSRQKGYLPSAYPQADSTQSVAMYFIQDMNNRVKMANNVIAEYGTSGSPLFKWAWLDEVKQDRNLGRAFVNSHVRRE